MTDEPTDELEPPQPVPITEIESIVGVQRWHFEHVARVALDGRLYILHSYDCLLAGVPDPKCAYTRALQNMNEDVNAARRVGATSFAWNGWGDDVINKPVLLELFSASVTPLGTRHWLRPRGILPEVFVPRPDSLVRKYRY